ncbi:septum formation initiator family protein [Streptococcus pyogenes]|nr:septum formation initiator family protein [Streptococcus pyogenes]
MKKPSIVQLNNHYIKKENLKKNLKKKNLKKEIVLWDGFL